MQYSRTFLALFIASLASSSSYSSFGGISASSLPYMAGPLLSPSCLDILAICGIISLNHLGNRGWCSFSTGPTSWVFGYSSP